MEVARISTAALRRPFAETQCVQLDKDISDVIRAMVGKPDGQHRHDGLVVTVYCGQVANVSPEQQGAAP